MKDKFEEKSTYTTKRNLYLFNTLIYEYDIHSANVSICERYNILDQSLIKKLKSLDKKRRVVAVGKMEKDKKFRDDLKEGFAKIRKEFYDANNLDIDDIISVKSDAIFTTKKCDVLTFGNLEFLNKNTYTSYIQLRKGIECYYSPMGILDVKGINDEVVKKHTDGCLKLLNTFFEKMETEDPEWVLKYMRRIVSMYKRRELQLPFYREFNADSMYRDKHGDKFDDYWDEDIMDLNIEYNFQNLIIPLTKIAM